MITDRDEIQRLIREHGRWWHEIELAPGLFTPGDDSNRMKLPILDSLGLPAEMPMPRFSEQDAESRQGDARANPSARPTGG